ncbi:tropomyosin isoform X1 [Strongylocentrotus purpuratus]|uniref:Tropomyosin n=1 Tax=Strongylocentrotus purpuratus TaxID=7668 RepID=A0A7M7HPA9_STRPU|nr:tropomyosin isoform X1 [Strongylocentrotus purpuratus]|eukprot:XP_011679984.1 PREDICTED: tropomyosin isoform X1 [Strongylocentrotus purpuratus]
METIKKKMLSLKSEKEVAIDAKEVAEADLRTSKEREEQLNDTIKERDDRIKQVELELDSTTDKLSETQAAFDEAEKAQGVAEAEVKNLNSKLILLEEDNGKQEEALSDTRRRLETIEVEADENLRARKVLETRSASDDDKIIDLEQRMKENASRIEELDRLHSESQRKLQMTEQQLEVAEAKNTECESKLAQLTDEITTLRNNCKSLEAQDRESTEREEKYEASIKQLRDGLDEASNRAEGAEGQVKSLQHQVDSLEEELVQEKEKSRGMNDEMDRCLQELNMDI